jgi:hypothetical protein
MESLADLEKASADILGSVQQKLNGDLETALDAIRLSAVNLPPLADHVKRQYQDAVTDTKSRQAAFQQSKEYAVQALASVAYQVQQLSGHFAELLDLEFAAIDTLDRQLRYPKQVSDCRPHYGCSNDF